MFPGNDSSIEIFCDNFLKAHSSQYIKGVPNCHVTAMLAKVLKINPNIVQVCTSKRSSEQVQKGNSIFPIPLFQMSQCQLKFAQKCRVPICRKLQSKCLSIHLNTNIVNHTHAKNKILLAVIAISGGKSPKKTAAKVPNCPSLSAQFRDLHSHFDKSMCWRLSLRCQV